jgi:GTP-binding protein
VPPKAPVSIIEELRKYDESLFRKARWLVLNKIDLIAEEEREQVVEELMSEYRREIGEPQRSFSISALSGAGCSELTQAVMDYLSESAEKDSNEATPAVATAEQSDH